MNLFWDSCVFNAFLYEESDSYDIESIDQLAETAGSKIKKKGVGGAMDFMNDLVGACIVIDASVNIIDLAGKLKDIPYRKQKSTKRLYRQVMPSCWRRRSI